jgi:hypothetical protein
MTVLMQVIRSIEESLDTCLVGLTTSTSNSDPVQIIDGGSTTSTSNSDPDKDPVQKMDQAVAFYVGSMEGQDGFGSGVLLYYEADRLCADFFTCGMSPSEFSEDGTSYVNREVIRQFQAAQRNVLAGSCEDAKVNKERIVQLMQIPLIQGVFKYGYERSKAVQPDLKLEAEGATYAAAVLPFLHACSPSDAEVVYLNMKVGHGGQADFGAVKAAFERQYDCLGLLCEEVGGVYDTVAQGFFPGAGPCRSKGKGRIKKRKGDGPDNNVGLAVGLTVGGLFLMLIIVFVASYLGPKTAAPAQLERKGDGVELS